MKYYLKQLRIIAQEVDCMEKIRHSKNASALVNLKLDILQSCRNKLWEQVLKEADKRNLGNNFIYYCSEYFYYAKSAEGRETEVRWVKRVSEKITMLPPLF